MRYISYIIGTIILSADVVKDTVFTKENTEAALGGTVDPVNALLAAAAALSAGMLIYIYRHRGTQRK